MPRKYQSKNAEPVVANQPRHLVKHTPVDTIKTDFGIVDHLNRKVGHRSDIVRVDSVPAQVTAKSYHMVPANLPMTFFQVTPHATRDGVIYGAGQPSVQLATLSEAINIAHTKATLSCKSYERKFGNTKKSKAAAAAECPVGWDKVPGGVEQ